MNKVPFLAFLSFVFSSLCAADVSFEGRWLMDGEPQPLKTMTCTVSFYSSADAASPAATLAGVPFKTDRDGYFVLSASAPSTLPDTFWVGVAPEGTGEISPRFRVAPAPFALAAVEAALVTNKTHLTLSGQATIERLEVVGGMVVGDLTSANGQSIRGTNLQIGFLRLSSLTLANGSSVGLFDATSGVSSPSFDNFSYDKTLGAEVSVWGSGTWWEIYGRPGHPDTERYGYELYLSDGSSSLSSFDFDSDGILLIALSANPKHGLAPQITLTIGSTKVLEALPIGAVASNVRVERIISMPYRAGENIALTLDAPCIAFWVNQEVANEVSDSELRGYEDDYRSSISAKIKLVRFGRK